MWQRQCALLTSHTIHSSKPAVLLQSQTQVGHACMADSQLHNVSTHDSAHYLPISMCQLHSLLAFTNTPVPDGLDSLEDCLCVCSGTLPTLGANASLITLEITNLTDARQSEGAPGTFLPDYLMPLQR